MNKEFDEVSQEDITNFFYNLNKSDTYKRIIADKLKLFYKWYFFKDFRTETLPDLVKSLKFNGKKKRKLPEEMLTEKEVRKLALGK
jgi:site-specific recombinase XerD